MKIGILSFSRRSPLHSSLNFRRLDETERILKETAERNGHICKILFFDKCQLYLANDKRSRILYKNKKISHYDVIIPKLDDVYEIAGETAILRQFELMGVPVMNNYDAILKVRNKLRTLQILAHNKIAIPKSMMVRRFEYLDKAVKRVGGYPVIVKTPYGLLERGVAIIESRRAFLSALDILWAIPHNNVLLIQAYTAENEGKNLRVFVAGDKVIEAIECVPIENPRANVQQWMKGVSVDLSIKEKSLAVSATKALGLQFAEVEILRFKKRSVVMEVNSNLGFGIADVPDTRMVESVIKYAVNFAKGRRINLKKVK